MRVFAFLTIVVVLGLLSCHGGAPSRQPDLAPTITNRGAPWQLRLHLDSSPSSRSPRARVIDGTVAPDFSEYRLDFEPLLGHSLALGIHRRMGNGAEPPIEITLGDLSSDHGIVTLRGRLVGRDSITGTWEEVLYCCGARGRFVLWRPQD